MSDQVGGRAVVLGGSMAGLLAARVLSERYGEVVIVDRDRLTGVTTARRGVPQGRHVHGLLARGQQILEELFPGFTQGAVDAGIPTGDLGELRWFFNGHRLAPGTTGLICVSTARPVLESHVRVRVAGLPNVTFAEETDILRLTTTEDRTTVTGVVVQRQSDHAELELTADLVVDATGRGSRMSAWLEELGYQRPEETKVKIDLSYTTRHYTNWSDEVLAGDLSINPVSTPAQPRGAFFSRIGHGKGVLSLTGVLGDAAPATHEGFMDFVKSLPVPDIYDLIKDAEPLDDPVSFRYPASVRKHFEKLTAFPQQLIVFGDAACSFNPVYGQGMTVAALESLVLRRHLLRGKAPDPAQFHKDIADVINVPWDISAGGDLSFAEVPGDRPAKVRFGNAYMGKLQAAATRDGRITRTFMRVAGLVDPPTALMKPSTMFRVLRNGRPTPPPAAWTPAEPRTRVPD